MGLFYIIAFSVITILGLVLAGWGSANKYGVLGGLRSSAQLISYEIPVIMVVIAVAMMAQSLNLVHITNFQLPGIQSVTPEAARLEAGIQNIPFAVLQPPWHGDIPDCRPSAEVGRTPFDIYFAESEIVGGPFVEYSGAHWSVFFLAEYMNTFIIAALTALLFLGGWHGPFNPTSPQWVESLVAVIWFLAKTYFVILVIFWIRGTFPRLRIDQLMALRLAGDSTPILRQHTYHGHLHVLRLALVEPDTYVSGFVERDRISDLQAHDRSCQEGGGGVQSPAYDRAPAKRRSFGRAGGSR